MRHSLNAGPLPACQAITCMGINNEDNSLGSHNCNLLFRIKLSAPQRRGKSIKHLSAIFSLLSYASIHPTVQEEKKGNQSALTYHLFCNFSHVFLPIHLLIGEIHAE
jgi:hypothetical protein